MYSHSIPKGRRFSIKKIFLCVPIDTSFYILIRIYNSETLNLIVRMQVPEDDTNWYKRRKELVNEINQQLFQIFLSF